MILVLILLVQCTLLTPDLWSLHSLLKVYTDQHNSSRLSWCNTHLTTILWVGANVKCEVYEGHYQLLEIRTVPIKIFEGEEPWTLSSWRRKRTRRRRRRQKKIEVTGHRSSSHDGFILHSRNFFSCYVLVAREHLLLTEGPKFLHAWGPLDPGLLTLKWRMPWPYLGGCVDVGRSSRQESLWRGREGRVPWWQCRRGLRSSFRGVSRRYRGSGRGLGGGRRRSYDGS